MDRAHVLVAAKAHPLLHVVDPAVLASLCASCAIATWPAKHTVLREGDPSVHVFFLLRGTARVFHRDAAGSEFLLKLFRAPALFGEMEALTGRPFLENVATLEESDALLIPTKTVHHLLETQHAFARALVFDLASRICISAHHLSSLAYGNVESRLANLLLDYRELFGVAIDGGTRLEIALSQEKMAHDLAVTRKALGEALASLRRRGIVDKRDARYVIVDGEALEQLGSGTLSISFRSGRPARLRR